MLRKLLLLFVVVPFTLFAADVKVDMFTATDNGPGDKVGEIVISESDYGLIFTPSLQSIAPGAHGFHVHANPDCSPATKDGKVVPAGAAGGHYDPDKKDAHKGPYDKDGRLGDLPILFADADGNIAHPALAPRITKIKQIKGRSLVLHIGGDNYSDDPSPLGGGGARLACGVIE